MSTELSHIKDMFVLFVDFTASYISALFYWVLYIFDFYAVVSYYVALCKSCLYLQRDIFYSRRRNCNIRNPIKEFLILKLKKKRQQGNKTEKHSMLQSRRERKARWTERHGGPVRTGNMWWTLFFWSLSTKHCQTAHTSPQTNRKRSAPLSCGFSISWQLGEKQHVRPPVTH